MGETNAPAGHVFVSYVREDGRYAKAIPYKIAAGRSMAAELFSGLPADVSDTERQKYWAAAEIPYRSLYAFDEALAVFGDRPGIPTSLLSAYERLTALLTRGPSQPCRRWTMKFAAV